MLTHPVWEKYKIYEFALVLYWVLLEKLQFVIATLPLLVDS